MPGALYLVSTPIGNLRDLSRRAVETLQSVDWIACEDTRQTAKLLEFYGIHKPTRSFHEHNEAAKAESTVVEIEAGSNVALVSDGGTPLVVGARHASPTKRASSPCWAPASCTPTP